MKKYEGIMKKNMKKYEGIMKDSPYIYGPWDLEKFRARPLNYGPGGKEKFRDNLWYLKIFRAFPLYLSSGTWKNSDRSLEGRLERQET